jgi:glucose/mannose-6-phosphate isomerase
MRDIILNFSNQFRYGPKVENFEKLKTYKSFVVVGMGGSGLVGKIMKSAMPEIDLINHADYGLPSGNLEGALVVCNSISGNTEEVLDAVNEAKKRGLDAAAISFGGKLIEFAKSGGLPYIQIPDTGAQPRMSVGCNIVALAKIMGLELPVTQLSGIKAENFEERGKELAEALKNYTPVICASNPNSIIAYLWKINFNENAKIPAFYNLFPELNHNEMTGFDRGIHNEQLLEKFIFMMLKDELDHPRVLRRMEMTAQVYRKRGLPVLETDVAGSGRFDKIFSSLILIYWTTYYLAVGYGVNPVEIPMVEEFKKMIE